MKLGELCEVVRGSSPRPKEDSRFYGGNVPRLMVADITRDGKYVFPKIDSLTEEGAKQSRPMKKGELVVAVSGNPGLPAILQTNACIHDGFAGLKNLRNNLISSEYLYHYLIFIKDSNNRQAVGAIFKNLTTQQIRDIEIPLPPLAEQKRIAAILDKADAIRRKRQEAIKLADELLRSVFLDMFGDPVTNPKGWEVKQLKEFGKVTTGNTPSREIPEYYGNEIEWIKSDNINTPYHILTKASEFLSKEGKKLGRVVPNNSILVTCIAGSPDCIGNVAIANREVAFNQQINAITPNNQVDVYFLYAQILVGKKLIQAASTNSMKGMVSKAKFEEVKFLAPPYFKQLSFRNNFQKITQLTNNLRMAYQEDEQLFNSLVQRAFRGEL